jgi:hypothetical protein
MGTYHKNDCFLKIDDSWKIGGWLAPTRGTLHSRIQPTRGTLKSARDLIGHRVLQRSCQFVKLLKDSTDVAALIGAGSVRSTRCCTPMPGKFGVPIDNVSTMIVD